MYLGNAAFFGVYVVYLNSSFRLLLPSVTLSVCPLGSLTNPFAQSPSLFSSSVLQIAGVRTPLFSRPF